ncbi:MAG: hypothetical protein HYV02_05875 [Deltaproteobacteria bacterium]|nr:hypothetical protein [Deltaproteobacteria bacterium]
MRPNRLQSQWQYIERKLCEHYPRVPRSLWRATEGEHERIVRVIRDTYVPGRSAITVEAEIRDRLNEWVAEIEAHV